MPFEGFKGYQDPVSSFDSYLSTRDNRHAGIIAEVAIASTLRKRRSHDWAGSGEQPQTAGMNSQIKFYGRSTERRRTFANAWTPKGLGTPPHGPRLEY